MQDYSYEYSHWNAKRSLSDWMKEENIPGIYGIDTRMLTKILRENGSMLGKIVYGDEDEVEYYDPTSENLVDKVSCREIIEYDYGEKKVVLVDCGVKLNIVRELIKQKVDLIRVPGIMILIKWNTMVLYFNGPGSRLLRNYSSSYL